MRLHSAPPKTSLRQRTIAQRADELVGIAVGDPPIEPKSEWIPIRIGQNFIHQRHDRRSKSSHNSGGIRLDSKFGPDPIRLDSKFGPDPIRFWPNYDRRWLYIYIYIYWASVPVHPMYGTVPVVHVSSASLASIWFQPKFNLNSVHDPTRIQWQSNQNPITVRPKSDLGLTGSSPNCDHNSDEIQPWSDDADIP